ncbi:hypothetical protein F3Y22_tig00109936pilonHSYRG00102 [Hibiscus syriacus]|uniref:Uncharacterized protein n=1 Tax=Hibiscus syriacus TaxID=106335 RepID=A0A6A3BT30_HIBSY|nr:uncharacterized protein LOC120210835 [Hibiscus syriacus]KAE8719655.1 hypothetical protein F3Y22_tig00109936pilonHSYRG00102 [Hibiscus syriacus]
MKLKNKGKVYPSSSSSGEDHLSVLNLLPATILTLLHVLSLDERETLAYMITRSLKTTTTNNNHSSSKKRPPPTTEAKSAHKQPVFDCDCFDCYTSYWFRWDSSPKRELIHQAIESFEAHLTNGGSPRPSKKNARLKRRDANSGTVTRILDSPVVALPGRSEQEVPDSKGSADEAPAMITDDVISTDKNVEEESAEAVEMTEDFPVAEEAERPQGSGEEGVTGHSRIIQFSFMGPFESKCVIL